MSYKCLHYHLVFSTHKRQPTIDNKFEGELYAYIGGITKNLGGMLRAINGMPDHVHLLVDIPSTISTSEFIKKVKQHSSRWMKENKHFPYWDGWEKSYSLFTCSPSNLSPVLKYIHNQKGHHRKLTFVEELREVFLSIGMPFDERYL